MFYFHDVTNDHVVIDIRKQNNFCNTVDSECYHVPITPSLPDPLTYTNVAYK